MLITEKIGKIKKNSVNLIKNLKQFSVKFNDPEAISKQLTVLIKIWGNFFSNLITLKQLASNQQS